MKPGTPILVTGSTGFIGQRLVGDLLSEGATVLGIARRAQSPADRHYRVVAGDLTHESDILRNAVLDFKPELVFHLAGDTGSAAADPRAVVLSALHVTENLLNVCVALSPRPRVVVASSSAVYGDSNGRRLTERAPTAAVNMYGISKILVEALAVRTCLAADLPVIRARIFNVIGPGQQPNRAVPVFARQIVEIEAGTRTLPLQTQGLSAWRDFIDVRDVTSGLRLLAQRGKSGGVYNLCSGRAVRVGDVLRRLLTLSRVGKVAVISTSEQGVRYQQGDCRRLLALGWRPRVSLTQSLGDVLEEWRALVAD